MQVDDAIVMMRVMAAIMMRILMMSAMTGS